MASLAIVILEIGIERLPGFMDGFIGLQINFFIFDAFPCPFDNDVVNPSTFSVHTDLDPVRNKRIGEFQGRELAALV